MLLKLVCINDENELQYIDTACENDIAMTWLFVNLETSGYMWLRLDWIDE